MRTFGSLPGQARDWLAPLLLLVTLACSPGAFAEAPSYREIVLSLANAPLEQRRLFASMALEELIRRHEQEAQRAARGKPGWQRGMRSYISKLQALMGRVPTAESVVLVAEGKGEVRMIVDHGQIMLAAPNLAGQGAFEREVSGTWCAQTACESAPAPTVEAALAETKSVESPDASAATVQTFSTTELRPGEPAVLAAPPLAAEPPQAPAGDRAPPVTADALDATAVPQPPALPAPGSPLSPAAPPVGGADLVLREDRVIEAPEPPPRPRETLKLTPAPVSPPPEPAPAAAWSFSDRAPTLYTAGDGLQCAFEDSRHLKIKQASCAAVMKELRQLASALQKQLAGGGTMDWARFALVPEGLDAPARVAGTPGRPLSLRLPYLQAAPAVLAGAVPWLRGRLSRAPVAYRIVAPEALSYLVPEVVAAGQ